MFFHKKFVLLHLYIQKLLTYMRHLLTILLLLLTLALPAVAADEIISYKLTRYRGGLPSNSVRAIYRDSVGYLYFQCQYDKCYQYDGYHFYAVPEGEEENLRKNNVRFIEAMQKDKHGGTVRTEGDMVYYRNVRTGHEFSFSIVDASLHSKKDNMKCRALLDKEGHVWASVNGNGIFFYNPRTGTLRHITSGDAEHIIDSDYIVYMNADHDGNVWIAQENMGVVCLRAVMEQSRVVRLMPGQMERANTTRAVRSLGDGTVLFCQGYGSVFRADSTLTDIRQVGHYDSYILCGCTDRQGRLWLGSRMQGINIDGRWYGGGRIDYITTDRKGRMWYCGLNGDIVQATLTSDGQMKTRHFLGSVPNLRPHTLLIDHRGRMVVGAESGVLRFQPDELLRDSTRYEWLTREPVVPLLEDSHNRLWAGTKGKGLLLVDDGTFVTTADGLHSNVVNSLAEDSKGRLCIGTRDGCTYFEPDSKRMHHLYFFDSPSRNFFNENEALPLMDGRMLLGTYDGLVIVNADFTMQREQIRTPCVTHLTINGNSYYDLPEIYGQTGDIWKTHEVELAHDENNILLSFSDFYYSENMRTLYSYRLEGRDKEWSKGSTINTAMYQELSPGTYTFRLRYQNGEGRWIEMPQPFTITILSPWWFTWWAIMVYILAFAAIVYTAYRHVRRINQLHQAVEVERQMTDYKLKFFTNISHEFRTPLTLIQGSMDRLSQLAASPLATGGEGIGSMRMPLSNMQRNVDRLLRLINQLLEFRRMQNNKLSLALEETDVVAFVRDLTESFRDAAEQKNISLSFLPTEKSYTMYADRGFLDKAVYNLLSNAFKFTPAKGSINVRLKIEDGRIAGGSVPRETGEAKKGVAPTSLKIIVEDTGIGVAEDQRDKIFDRFSRGRQRRDSLGIGLDLTAELMRTHHGDISYEPNPVGGSIFTITLPTDASVYKKEDFLTPVTPAQQGIAGEGQEEAARRQVYGTEVKELIGKPMNDRLVLIVEDDADILSYMQQELSRYFRIITANDGQEALDILLPKEEEGAKEEWEIDTWRRPDLIITDYMMPRMNGMQLLKRLRHDRRTLTIPVIMLTALTDTERQQRTFEAGADTYITKPFAMQTLLMHCRSLMEQHDRYRDAFVQEPKRPKNVTPTVVTDQRDERLVNKFTVYVEQHLADPDLSAESIADAMQLGRTTFFNKMKQLTGQTPNEYIREKRLARACELLRSDDRITVSEVAYSVGLRTPNYFITTFKKRFGITPSQYQAGMEPEE